MGIDLHNLQFLAHAADRGARFGQTLAIGRQAVFIDDHAFERHRALRQLPPLRWPAGRPGEPRYFEPLLTQWFGAAVTQSVDASAYEHASFIHDLNLRWPAGSPELGRYDAVLDFGCLEHVFNFPVAWRNCVDLCRVGGHLLHALPANNLAGHGFYQFSPELFFNLYRAENGFDLLDVFFALKADSSRWWRVADPARVRRRVVLRNSHEVYLLVLARKRQPVGPLEPPQQSDYAQGEWVRGGLPPLAAAPMVPPAKSSAGRVAEPSAARLTEPSPEHPSSPSTALPARPSTMPSTPPPSDARRRVADALARLGLIDAARRLRERARAVATAGLALPAPDYQRIDVEALLRRR